MTHHFGSTLKGVLAAGALALLPMSASAQVPLAEEPHINEQLMAAAVGDAIRKTCPSISARMVTVYFKAKELEKYARNAGYQEAEVKAFLKDKTEKARIKSMAAEYMAANGVLKGNAATYCALGNAEIKKDSLIGSLLRSN
jgi:hypothetical protein